MVKILTGLGSAVVTLSVANPVADACIDPAGIVAAKATHTRLAVILVRVAGQAGCGLFVTVGEHVRVLASLRHFVNLFNSEIRQIDQFSIAYELYECVALF